MGEMAEPKYGIGATFIIDNEEPCGYVAYDEIIEVRDGLRYRVNRCSLSGEVIKSITLDEEDIDDGVQDGIAMCDDAVAARTRILQG